MATVIKWSFILGMLALPFSVLPAQLVAVETGSAILAGMAAMIYPSVIIYWKRKTVVSIISAIASEIATKWADYDSKTGKIGW